jgi:hypothetical protein
MDFCPVVVTLYLSYIPRKEDNEGYIEKENSCVVPDPRNLIKNVFLPVR